MKKTAFVVVAAVLAFAAQAFATPTSYIGLSAGLTMPSDSSVSDGLNSADMSFKTGYGISVVSGVKDFMDSGLRPEIEFAYKAADYNKFTLQGQSVDLVGDVSAFAMMANIYYDIKSPDLVVTPYLGGGIGYANIHASGGSVGGVQLWNSANDNVFAYQAGAGFRYDVSKHVGLDLGYRYFGTSDPKFDTIKAEFQSHNVQLGVLYNF